MKERKYDQHGEVVFMAQADGWIMVRRPRCVPFTMTKNEWSALADERPPEPDAAQPDAPSGG